ncbi:hypothetical protein HYPSUDRAFT_1026057 [Hypholoma sublateritium FD-334 SS-4]|uniref:Uncharacterized protein n=1 Tax=Hypholoma sublateritium (strain FD-334 SS-4) TaxID=945553 RepID=A0A0D2PAD3_HYPSF|nr:hypothetical protein HYPSUDRAFT_1026057 [Hypholoma sublateritium FD-334 SS-4]
MSDHSQIVVHILAFLASKNEYQELKPQDRSDEPCFSEIESTSLECTNRVETSSWVRPKYLDQRQRRSNTNMSINANTMVLVEKTVDSEMTKVIDVSLNACRRVVGWFDGSPIRVPISEVEHQKFEPKMCVTDLACMYLTSHLSVFRSKSGEPRGAVIVSILFQTLELARTHIHSTTCA